MRDSPEFAWLRLSRLPGIGPKALWTLHQAAAAESVTVCELLGAGRPQLTPAAVRLLDKIRSLLDQQPAEPLAEELSSLHERRVRVLHPDDPCYPAGVVRHGDAFAIPPVLFARGHLPIAGAPSAAIVGSRNVEEDGLEFARRLAGELAQAGLSVASGYAKGVDSAAHVGALAAGGTTAMVLSLGILNFEARSEVKPLFSASNALVLSQFHPRARWLARNAMARNKLVCALASVLVVVASGPERDGQGRHSGTFDAAKTALAMGLPVFVLSPRALRNPPLGNAVLLREGARELFPEHTAEQVMEAVSAPSGLSRTATPGQYAMF